MSEPVASCTENKFHQLGCVVIKKNQNQNQNIHIKKSRWWKVHPVVKELSPVWLRSVSPGASALRSLSQCASAWPELFPGFQSARRIERSLAATGSSQNSVTACALIHNFFFKEKEGWRDILTKHKMAKMKRGMVDRPSSQRQPRVGITRMAKRTSNTVPRAQNICKTDLSSLNTAGTQELFAGVMRL